ncbi:RCC1-like G exchanging factor-like protein isoform X2 [Stegostoma tigrinum]|uniref:RCC1-like G exchanging factor-like protein isoform X2 n=1 Tax=Stegostoma tigrinum TaxID=3053191 RepID=UPI0028705312|nr:RCC1-like G exchanging factor-like protein isoform X2 [Stegostoma tigrinum]
MSLRSCGWRWLQARGLRGAQAPDPVLRYMGKGRRKSRVFVWGFAHTGALGLPHLVLGRSGGQKPRQIQLRPCGVELEQRISSAACGYGFTLLASQTRDITKVWGMGLNKDSQIGFHRSRADRIFSMGNNAYGQCGRSIVDNEIYSGSQIIHRIEDLDDKIVEVTCGQDHSLFRTEKGEIYSCGWGADGQTGLGHYGVTCKLTRLTGDIAGVNIVQTATYGDFCLAVSKDGNLFGWGNSEYLQFSAVTEATQVSVPKHLPFKGVGKIKQAACGGTHAAILNREGNVFVWGYGILGKGCNLSESGMPEMIPSTLFGCSEFTPEVQVDHIRCGLNHFAAITNRGELFVWGKNLRGCLGIGSMDDQYFPWRVTVPGNVVDVACGVDHMVALTKSFI